MLLLIDCGADINAPASKIDAGIALQAAAENGHLACVESLLDKGADVNAHPGRKSRGGRTALQAAVGGGHVDIVKLPVSGHDAHVNAVASDFTALHEAARSGDVEIVQFLLDNGADSNVRTSNDNISGSITNDNGCKSPLVWVLDSGHIEVSRLPLESGTDVSGFVYSSHDTPPEAALVAASRGGHLAIVQQFLDMGADLEGRGEWVPLRPSCFALALQNAAGRGHESVVRLLLKRRVETHDPVVGGLAEGNYVGWYKPRVHTALAHAAKGCHMNIMLSEDGIELSAAAGGGDGMIKEPHRAPLVQAATNGHVDIVLFLMPRSAAAIHKESWEISRASAISVGDISRVSQMLKRWPEIPLDEQRRGATPTHYVENFSSRQLNTAKWALSTS